MIYSCNAVWRMLCEERDPWEAGQMLERMIVHLEDPEAEEKFCPSGCPDCPGGFELSTWDVPSMINAIWLTFTKGPMRVSPNCVAKVGVGRFGCFASVAGDYGPPKIAWEATEAMLEACELSSASVQLMIKCSKRFMDWPQLFPILQRMVKANVRAPRTPLDQLLQGLDGLLLLLGESHPGMWSELAKSVVALSHAAANFAVLSETRASPVGKLFGKDADWAFPAYDREQLLPTLPPEEQAHIAKCALLVRSFTRLFHTLKRTAGKDVRHAVLLSGLETSHCRLVDMYFTRSSKFSVEVLAPTCLQIAQEQAGFSLVDSPAVYQLMTGCALKLQQAIHLTHPNTINVELGKHNWWECKHLEDLQLFLLDPKQDTWTIAMTEEEAEQVYELMSGVNDCEVYENEEFYENEIFDSTAPDVPGETITLTFNKVGCVRQQDRLGEAKLTLQLVQRTVCQVTCAAIAH